MPIYGPFIIPYSLGRIPGLIPLGIIPG